MTVFEAMRRRAIEEFDQLVAEQEKSIRATMAADGCPRAEIDRHIASCQPSLDEQRRAIVRMVLDALAKNDIPLETPAHAWIR